MADKDPDNPSADYAAMAPFWMMVTTILAGTDDMRKAGEKYLPKFEAETQRDYDFRRLNAKFTNVYRDIVEGLAAKPFAKELTLAEGASAEIKKLAEDVDGRGSSIHVFGSHLFFAGINDAVSWILVDKTQLPEGVRSRADEQAIGARPYWVHVPALRMLAVYSAIIDGAETIVHARILEPTTVREGFTEKMVKRVRIFDREVIEAYPGAPLKAGPPTFRLMEEQTDKNTGVKAWVEIAQGTLGIGVIPLVPFITGRRLEGSWRFVPPMQDAAYLQVEHFQQESKLKHASDATAFPMLSGNGVGPPLGPDGKPAALKVGPKVVLYAPATNAGSGVVMGSWTFIEPSGSSLTFLSGEVDKTEARMRELGRQPLTAQSGNLTVVTTVFAASKGNSAVQAWCLNLKDALENAEKLTAMWLGETVEPEVTVHTDFAIDIESEQAGTVLMAMRTNKDISREALITEAKRRDWLSPEYDAEVDLVKILAETPAGEGDQNVPPAPGP